MKKSLKKVKNVRNIEPKNRPQQVTMPDDVYREINLGSFQENYKLLIGHYKHRRDRNPSHLITPD